MHVLILPSWYSTPDRPLSGGYFQDQASALAQAGHDVGVAYVEDRSLRRITVGRLLESRFQNTIARGTGIATVRTRGWTVAHTDAGAHLWCALTRRLVRYYVRHCGVPDVVHAHGAVWAGVAAIEAARRLGRPCVVTEHSSGLLSGTMTPSRRAVAAGVYREADAVVAVSATLLRSMKVAGGRPGIVIPNTVDTSFFTLPVVERSKSILSFLSVSNLVPSKRIDLLIRAFSRAFGGDPRVRLVIVGSGSEETALRSLSSASGAGAQVEFTGSLNREQVRERMWQASALVMPSAFETFGVVLVEALATGLPVIASRCGGPEDFVSESVGALIPLDDESSLSAALRRAGGWSYDEGTLRRHAVERFSYGVVASQLVGMYESIGRARAGRLGGRARAADGADRGENPPAGATGGHRPPAMLAPGDSQVAR